MFCQESILQHTINTKVPTSDKNTYMDHKRIHIP